MNNKVKKIISYAIVTLLLVILAFAVVSKFILKTELIKLFDYAFLVVLTGSMEPNIHTGEFIIIKEENNYRIGDVITYKDEDNNFITHRIVSKDDDKYVTQGDSNNLKDDAISLDRIEGKVIYHSQEVGYFILYWLKPLTIIYIIAIICYEKYSTNTNKKNKLIKRVKTIMAKTKKGRVKNENKE
jgi:signal peptidase